MVKKYYTYVILDGETPLYVGKGQGGRCFEHLRQKQELFDRPLTIKVDWHESEIAALTAEAVKINDLLDAGFELLNVVRPRRPDQDAPVVKAVAERKPKPKPVIVPRRPTYEGAHEQVRKLRHAPNYGTREWMKQLHETERYWHNNHDGAFTILFRELRECHEDEATSLILRLGYARKNRDEAQVEKMRQEVPWLFTFSERARYYADQCGVLAPGSYGTIEWEGEQRGRVKAYEDDDFDLRDFRKMKDALNDVLLRSWDHRCDDGNARLALELDPWIFEWLDAPRQYWRFSVPDAILERCAYVDAVREISRGSPERSMNIGTSARYLGLSDDKFRLLRRSGRGPGDKSSFTGEELDDWLSGQLLPLKVAA